MLTLLRTTIQTKYLSLGGALKFQIGLSKRKFFPLGDIVKNSKYDLQESNPEDSRDQILFHHQRKDEENKMFNCLTESRDQNLFHYSV